MTVLDRPEVGERLRFYAKTLIDTTNDVIGRLDAAAIGGPVNWADLGCTDARLTIDDVGNSYWSVLVSEASPGAAELSRVLTTALVDAGYPHVSVETEW